MDQTEASEAELVLQAESFDLEGPATLSMCEWA